MSFWIIKHTKKIYNTAKEPKHSLDEKLKEIFIEIFIIVFAVSLSILQFARFLARGRIGGNPECEYKS